MIATADLIIFGFYVVALLSIGLIKGRKKNMDSAQDFFLTNHSLPWYAIGFSFIAAGISSAQLLGTIGFAYRYGIAVSNWEWLNGPAILAMVFIFVPLYIRRNLVTMPQFLELRYNKKTRNLFAIITLLTYIFINLAGVLFSGGFILNKIFGIPMQAGIWSMVVISGLFIFYGGMESVAWTNLLQGIILLVGGLTVFFLGCYKIPGGWPAILGTGERSHLILPASHPDIPWSGLLVLALSTNIWFFCTNQTINQSALGAKNEWHARMGVLLVGFLTILIVTVDVFPGLIAYALDPHLGNPDEAYPFVIQRLVPIGLKGLVFAAICGTIIANIEALGHACSTIFAFDIFKEIIRKDATQRQMINAGRMAGLISLAIGALWAPAVNSFGQIFSYFQEGWAFIAIPVAVIFVLGVLWKGFSPRAAFLTLCLSFPLLALPYFLRIMQVKTNVFNVAGFVLAGCIFFAFLMTKMAAGNTKPKESFQWTPNMVSAVDHHRPWFQQVRFWSLILVLIYIFLYTWFW